MTWVRGFGGAVLVLLGLLWIGQGLNVVRGSGMSGHSIFAIIGLLVALAGIILLWGLTRTGAQARRH